MTRPGIEPKSLRPLANTLTIMPTSGKTANNFTDDNVLFCFKLFNCIL